MNIGILGAENSHAKHFCETINRGNRFPGYRITHLYAADAPQVGEELARDYGLTLTDSEDAVIAACDAVVVTYRKGSLHAAPVLRALKAGKAVFNDKPFSTDVEKAAEIVAYAREHQLLVCGGSNLKGLPNIAAFKPQITPGATVVITFAADPNSEYDGYWFYGIHAAELCLTLCGTDYRDVAAFRTGDTVVATVRFDQVTCVLVTTPGIQDLHISINADGKNVAHNVEMAYQSVGPAELVTMLKTGQPPRDVGFYEAATRLLTDIIKAAGL